MFSTTVSVSSQCDIRGLAAARMDVRAFREQIIPALAIESVCCSYIEIKKIIVQTDSKSITYHNLMQY